LIAAAHHKPSQPMSSIELRDVGIRFRTRAHRRIPLKDYLIGRFFRNSVNPFLDVHALADINLSITEGERIGLIGGNGAGKSTMLRLLAGIYPPTSGTIDVEGEIASLLDIGIGVQAEASGWENIAYRCYLNGDTPAQLREKRQEIAEFSELGRHLEMPVRFYSSGMQVRLLFSLATAIEPDVLLIDEVLSAGDMGFYAKARRRMEQLIERSRILVMASHDFNAVQAICTRVLWLDQGRIRREGSPAEVIAAYREFMTQPQTAAA
jgi:ABC-type polysaccharide/polyol phosphate transport system ATPase subunit